MLKILTAGESHGRYLVGILEGMPAGIEISEGYIEEFLTRRRGGYGRGRRMNFEKDRFSIVGGVIRGKTTGAPFAILMENSGARDLDREPPRRVPRPGHADFAGALKYGFLDDFVPVIERSSARETAVRTALLSLTHKFLMDLGIRVAGFTKAIGHIRISDVPESYDEIVGGRNNSIFYFPDPCLDEEARKLVDRVQNQGDTLGGIFEVRVFGVLPGLGSYVDPFRKLDGRIAQVIMSLNGVKAVEVGEGIEISQKPGTEAVDEFVSRGGIRRVTNRAGGIEGGMTNGEMIVVRGYMKPISTMRNRRRSFDLQTLEEKPAPYIRSDTVVVPAASVIAETLVSYVIADAILEKFGGDTLEDVKKNINVYRERIRKFLQDSHF